MASYQIYTEEQLAYYASKTNSELALIMHDDQAARIAYAKRRFHITGDVYFITPYNIINGVDGHMCAFPESAATTLAEMAQEMITAKETE